MKEPKEIVGNHRFWLQKEKQNTLDEKRAIFKIQLEKTNFLWENEKNGRILRGKRGRIKI